MLFRLFSIGYTRLPVLFKFLGLFDQLLVEQCSKLSLSLCFTFHSHHRSAWIGIDLHRLPLRKERWSFDGRLLVSQSRACSSALSRLKNRVLLGGLVYLQCIHLRIGLASQLLALREIKRICWALEIELWIGEPRRLHGAS